MITRRRSSIANCFMDPTVIQEKEQEALALFKDRIQDILPTLGEYHRHDLSLLRWLRARELNINQSEDMLRKSIAWRAKNDIDSRLQWMTVPDFLSINYPYQISGFSKNGNLVVCAPVGRWDVRKGVSSGFKLDMISYVDQLCEVVMNFMGTRSTKNSIQTQCTLVLDYEGFSLVQLTSKETIECALELVRRFEGNYPEILRTAWVVNAPKIYEILFSLIKPLLTPRTTAKIRVFGSNCDQWRQALLETIEPDQLPSSFGGSNTSCKNYKAVDGVDVFPVHEIFPENEFITVPIDAGMKHVLKYSLFTSSKICWNFRTVDYDIGFLLLYRDTGTGTKGTELEAVQTEDVIFECARTDSHRHLQTGEFVADKPGIYSLVFDNSFSKFRKKSLSYFVRTSTYTDKVTGLDVSSINIVES